MVDVAKVKAVVSADSKDYEDSMKSVAATTSAAGLSMKALGGMVVGLGGALVGLFAAFKAISFVVNTTKLFIDFEEQLFRTSAIMKQFLIPDANESAQAMADLETEIRTVAAGSKFTATEVGAMAETLALAGLSLQQLSSGVDDFGEANGNALKTMVDFAVVAGTDVETAAGIGIASLKGFRLEIDDLERVTSVLANTFTSSFVNLQQLGDSMRFFGPTAAAAGVSISEAAAAVGALGDAGLQGSMAGTGLRQAINKLIAPTDDARRTMQRLGFEFTTLSPAGQAADSALSSTIRTMDGLESSISKANAELSILQNELNDMSMEEEQNSINIARIRQRAEKQNRKLTKTEIATIGRLEKANQELSLAQREGSLEERRRQKEVGLSTTSLNEQQESFKELKSIVESQTTGVGSLVDMIEELNASGATTAEILEIFGVRGGGAILALQGNAKALREIADANKEVFEATDMNNTLQDQFVRQLMGSTAFALDETRSKFEELSLIIGEPFARLITQEGGIKQTLDTAIEKAGESNEAFTAIADSISVHLLPAFAEAFKPDNVEKFLEAVKTIVPEIIQIIGVLAKMAEAIEPILDAILKVTDVVGITGDEEEIGAFREDRLVGMEGETRFDSVKDVGKFTAAGATIGGVAGLIGGPAAPATVPAGIAVGGAIGTGVGLGFEVAQGLAQGFSDWSDDLNVEFVAMGGMAGPAMAKGGIVTKPTFNATIGEGGQPEAVIPLNRLPDLIPKIVLPASSNSTEQVINLTFDSINIGAGNNVTAGDVRQIIENEMPKIIRSSLTRGVRGVL